MGCERSASSACCNVLRAWKVSLADADGHVIPVRLDHLHLGGLEHVQVAAELREQSRAFLAGGARTLELREQTGQQSLAFVHSRLGMPRPDPRQRAAKSFLVERLEQVVHGADLECFERVGVVGRDEHQGG